MDLFDLPIYDIKFERIFSSPYFWNAHKHTTFWNCTYNNIKFPEKPKYTNDSIHSSNSGISHDKEDNQAKEREAKAKEREAKAKEREAKAKDIEEFRKKLNKSATNIELFPGGGWDNEIETKFFNELERYVGEDYVKTYTEHYRSVVTLNRLVRNSGQHDEVGMHDDIRWYICKQDSAVKIFDEFPYAKFWISRYPTLSCFLWDAFKSRSDQIPAYYKGNLDFSDEKSIFFTPQEIAEGLKEACKEQTNAGFLERRFTVPKKKDSQETCVVELRPLDANLLGRILNKSRVAKMVIKEGKMDFKWSNSPGSYQCFSYKLSSNGQENYRPEDVTYLFTDRLEDAEKILSGMSFGTDKVVVFFPPDSIDKLVTYCAQNHKNSNPVTWNDISNNFKDQLQISFKGATYSLEMALLNSPKYNEILDMLSGEELNSLLRNKLIEILDKPKLPAFPEYSLSRNIIIRGLASSNFFSAKSPKDIFVIIKNYTEKKLEILDSKHIDKKCVFPILNLEDENCSIYILEGDLKTFERDFSKFLGCSIKNVNVHFFKSIENDNFVFLNTWGEISGIMPDLQKEAEKKFTEQKFLEYLSSDSGNNEKLIYISGKLGMGKSHLISRLARRFEREHRVLVFSMKIFMDHLENIWNDHKKTNSSVSLQNVIIMTLAEICCTKGFKINIFVCILTEKAQSLDHEIFLDGLDEVKSSLKSLAFDVLKALRYLLPAARFWVTLKDSLLDYMQHHFGSLGYFLDEFGENEQITLYTRHWFHCWKRSKGSFPTGHVWKRFRDLAKLCIERYLSDVNKKLAGIPLLCRITAVVCEPYALKQSLDLDSSKSIYELFDKLSERMLDVFINEKEALNNPKYHSAAKRLDKEFFEDMVELSIKSLFPNFCSSRLQTCAFFKTDFENISHHDLIRHGAVTSTNPPVFFHQSYAEYLAAKFVFVKIMPHLEKNGHLNNLDTEFATFLLEEVLQMREIKDRENNLLSYEFRNKTILVFVDEQLEKRKLGMDSETLEKQEKYARLANNICDYCSKQDLKLEYNFLKRINLAASLGLKNIVQLLISFPYGDLHAFLYGIHANTDNILKPAFKALTRGAENWDKIPAVDINGNGLLHHIIDSSIRYSNVEEKLETLWVRAKEYVGVDSSILEEINARGETPFLYFARKREEKVREYNFDIVWGKVKILLDFNANVNAVDSEGNTVLHYFSATYLEGQLSNFVSVLKKHMEFVNLMIEKGYSADNLNLFNSFGENPLLVALCKPLLHLPEESDDVDEEYSKIIKTFAKYEMDFNSEDKHGRSLLHRAIQMDKNKNILSYLIDQGAKVSAVDSNRNSVLHILGASSVLHVPHCFFIGLEEKLHFVKFFKEKGCGKDNFNLFNSEGLTPLLAALHDPTYNISEGESEILEKAYNKIIGEYINHGTKINAKDEFGNSVVHRAIMLNKGVQVIKSLIHNQADILAVNKKGHNSAKIAHQSKNLAVYQFLLGEYNSLFKQYDGNGGAVEFVVK